MLIYTGDAFPAWQGSIFNGGLAGEQLARVTVDEERRFRCQEVLVRDLGRIRDVRQGPDGLIYLAMDHRGDQTHSILRLEPVR